MSADKKKRLEEAITAWVGWYRGVNDPSVQRKVAERQVGMLLAEQNMSHVELVEGGRQVRRAIIYPKSTASWEALKGALRMQYAKSRIEVLKDDDRAIPRDMTLRGFLKRKGEKES